MTIDAPQLDSPPKKNHVRLYVGIAVAAVLVIGAGVGIPMVIAHNERVAEEEAAAEAEQAAKEAEQARLAMFSEALAGCGIDRSDDVRILDFGESIVFDAVAQTFLSPVQLDNVGCVLSWVDAPESVKEKIGATRALDGTRTAEWDGFSAEWRYHPDDGATVLIEHQD